MKMFYAMKAAVAAFDGEKSISRMRCKIRREMIETERSPASCDFYLFPSARLKSCS